MNTKKTTRRPFDLQAEITKAWSWCWDYYCGGDHPRQAWLTATDLERRVRAAAVEQMDGLTYGKMGADAGGSRVRISGGDGETLLDSIRHWLRAQVSRGVLTGHNFGRGHCSGMRFRPIGDSLTAAEQATIQKRADRAAGKTLVHHLDPTSGQTYDGKTLCTHAARQNKPRSGWKRSRSMVRITRDHNTVTCPRCRKLIESGELARLEQVAADRKAAYEAMYGSDD